MHIRIVIEDYCKFFNKWSSILTDSKLLLLDNNTDIA